MSRYSYSQNFDTNVNTVGCLVFIAFFLLFFGSNFVYTYGTTDEVVFTVNKMENVAGNQHSKYRYLIFTNNEVFENQDSWLRFKFNSSDMYNEMKVGTTYKAKVYGWRVRFLSWYRNVVSVEVVE